MELTLQNLILILLIVLTGMSAGLCFNWGNTITPGLGELNDFQFLNSFQQLNRTIQNPLFFMVFFGPFILGIANIFILKNNNITLLWPFFIASGIYFIGLVLVTIFGNVPLNEILDKSDLTTMSDIELRSLRDQFESKWNRLHLIRTISALISFIILILNINK
ncbi:MAG: DUF1772 domain-containing protein [Psychroserpens sp.]|nr:DUF1772 domain-containing protein [Psychroserpens sp.]